MLAETQACGPSSLNLPKNGSQWEQNFTGNSLWDTLLLAFQYLPGSGSAMSALAAKLGEHRRGDFSLSANIFGVGGLGLFRRRSEYAQELEIHTRVMPGP